MSAAEKDLPRSLSNPMFPVTSQEGSSRLLNRGRLATPVTSSFWSLAFFSKRNVTSNGDRSHGPRPASPPLPLQEATPEQPEQRVADLGDVKFANEGISRRIFIFRVSGVLIVGALVGLLFLAINSSSSSSVTESFCGSEEEEAEARDIVAREFFVSGTTVGLQNVFLPCFPPQAFRELSEVTTNVLAVSETLVLEGLGISAIASDAFPELPSLKKLLLNSNGLHTIPDLSSMPNLAELQLERNGITSINAEVLKEVNLELLSLAGNPLVRLDEGLASLRAREFKLEGCTSTLFVERSCMEASEVETVSLNGTTTEPSFDTEVELLEYMGLL